MIFVLIISCNLLQVNMMPIFENKMYSFWLKPDTLGVIGSVLAIVEADTESVVSYQLEITDGKYLFRVQNAINEETSILSGKYKNNLKFF